MAQKKSANTLEVEIAIVKSDMTKLLNCYNKLVEKLMHLQAQKRQIETDVVYLFAKFSVMHSFR